MWRAQIFEKMTTFVHMAIRITLLEQYDARLVEAFARLIPQLSSTAPLPDERRLRAIIESPASRLLVAEDEASGEIVGTLTLALYEIPTSRKAWIEDVVTDESVRGQGVGRALVERAIELARSLGVDSLNLTSRPFRIAARRLYAKCGFSEVDTTVFRL